jgi:hypothetical protein
MRNNREDLLNDGEIVMVRMGRGVELAEETAVGR